MAENETGTVEQDQAQAPFTIRVEEAGPGTKKVFVEVPKERVAGKLAEQYKELRQEAVIPGFRKGHAPQKLIEKRFGDDVKDQVRRALVSESYQEAVEKNSLTVVGEPEFDNPEQIQLAEDGPLTYSFQVEVQPDITLPELKGVKVRKPKVQVTEDHVSQAMTNLREQQGTLVPVEDRGVAEKDHILVEAHVKADGVEIAHREEMPLLVKAGPVFGIQIDDLDKQLAGAKAGDVRTITAKGPDAHPTEAIRGKDVQLELKIKDIKRLEAAEINQDFLTDLGFANEQELRDALREQMVERVNNDVAGAMRAQVVQHLMDNTQVEVSAKLSQRQTQRVIQRRGMQLMMRGVPREQIEANIQRLSGGAEEEAARELKAFFVLQKVAQQFEIDPSEGELNGRIAAMAIQQGRRPEKLKQEMSKDGSLANLYIQMREEKAIDKILETAVIEEIESTPAQAAQAAEATSAEGAHPESTST